VSNPKQLRKYLNRSRKISAGRRKISDDDIAGGLLVHLGNHVAAVMEDRPPLGVLDRGDLVAHQLEGVPKILSLGQLVAKRETDHFDLLRAPHQSENVDVLLGGDVMLGRTVGAAIATGADPLAGVRSRLDRASSRMVNLECVLSDKGNAVAGKVFFARPARGDACPDRGANQRGQPGANNHANDFGPEALLDSICAFDGG
jgi:hypothetical protein